MLPGLPAWCHLGSQDEKYVYRHQTIWSYGLTKHLPDRQIHLKLGYYMYSTSLQNYFKMFECFQTSHVPVFCLSFHLS